MDYGRTSNDWTVPGSPQGAWVSISSLENYDYADDRMLLAVWPAAGADEPTQRFEVYRDGPGWQVLETGLYGSPHDMAAAYRWWTEHRDTPTIRGYQVLAAVQAQDRCTDEKLAAELGLRVEEVHRGGRYGGIAEALTEMRLVGVHRDGWYAVTPDAAPVLQPAGGGRDPAWFGPALQAKLAQQGNPRRPVGPGQAFPALRALGGAGPQAAIPSTADAPPGASRGPRGR